MKIKILQVFLGADGLPYKDQERTVHFPIIGSGFMGASNTTQIKFYFKEIGDDAVKYVAVSKLPNGKVGSKVLENYYDSELDEPYALLELDSYYTQYKGDLFISLQGYQGGVQVTYDEDTELYEIEGTPTIQATGSIKFTNNYATQFVGSGEEQNVTLQQLLAIISDTVLRYYFNSGNTLAEVFDEIGTKICVLNVEGDEYLCEMSGDTNIVLYDIHNQEWYAFTGANTTTIDSVLQDSNKQIIATQEDLENFGNLFTYKGAASVSEINALTDIDNGWCYNLTDSGTLTLGNLQVETGDNVAFNGTIWTKLSSETILGNYYTKEEGQAFETEVDERVTSVENELSSVASGSPKGVYATLAALQAAYPTGAEGIYVVQADGHWYYWNGSAWTDGGVYLSTINAVPETRTIAGIDLVDNITKNELESKLKYVEYKSKTIDAVQANEEQISFENIGLLSNTTGEINASETAYKTSNYIDLTNVNGIYRTGTTIMFTLWRYAFYDENYSFLGIVADTTNYTIVTHDGKQVTWLDLTQYPTAKYIRISWDASRPYTYWVDKTVTYYKYDLSTITINGVKPLKFAGKKIVNFGDSIFGNYRDTNNTTDKSISKMIEEATGAIVYNAGFGGCRMSYASQYWRAFSMYALADAITTGVWTDQDAAIAAQPAGMPSYFSETLAMLKAIDFDEIDYITIAYGTNDYTGDIFIDYRSGLEEYQYFKGAIQYSVRKILQEYPHIRIAIISPCWRWFLSNGTYSYSSDDEQSKNGRDLMLTDYVSACKEMCEKLHIAYIDTYYTLGYNQYSYTYYFPSNDGTHPNEPGRQLRADRIVGEMEKLF